ncbi:bestrophin family protein [Hymenobacter elongatus]|uniref:Multidrug transporter n=1 Tax=Hymenobacter elongatus TaxID=877208 RepID=A0A4Z0PGD1_9BACT|nr:bestrophin family ion channel [Hymenobacter elongatus]TGE13834.1 multidrug transporter [Hymenobacter elongatus]
MHAGHHYTLKEVLLWTRREIMGVFVLALVPTVLYAGLGWHWLAMPWVPIALVGTATAFIVGFKNNATYSRLWEARQIWGTIVNISRAWGVPVRDFVPPLPAESSGFADVRQQLTYRHLAWLTALRFQLREPRAWESMTQAANAEYSQLYRVTERDGSLADELQRYLTPADAAYVLSKKNRATHLLGLQSKQLKELADNDHLEMFRYFELVRQLTALYEQQGKCERLKNFPYPRQFATINLFFARLFVCLVPFGMLQEFEKLGGHFVWLTIPFSMLVSWIFLTMERIGESTENPFEGGANDVPITALARTIEIDLRELLDEADVPAALQPVNNILM